jgi:sugar phosphate permease
VPGRWTSLAGATAAQVGISYLEQGVAALVPYIKAEFGLSSSVAGLFGTSLNVGRALAGTLAIAPVSRHGERRMILVGGFASGVLALLASVSPTSPLTLLLLVASGLAQTVSILAGIVAVAVWFRGGGRGIAMGIRQAAVPIAGAIAAASLPFLALEIGWRHALAVAGGASIVATVLGALVYRDHGEPAAAPAVGESARAALRSVVREPRLARAVLAGSVLAAGQFVTLAYIQLFLVEDLHASLRFAALVLVATQVAGIVGRLAWGAASDIVFGGRRSGVLLAILLLATGGCVGMGLAAEGQQASVGIPMAVLLGLTTVGSPGVYLALISDLSPPRGGVAAMGVAITFIQGAALVVPPVFGALADATDSYRLGWFALAGLLLATVPAVRSIARG